MPEAPKATIIVKFAKPNMIESVTLYLGENFPTAEWHQLSLALRLPPAEFAATVFDGSATAGEMREHHLGFRCGVQPITQGFLMVLSVLTIRLERVHTRFRLQLEFHPGKRTEADNSSEGQLKLKHVLSRLAELHPKLEVITPGEECIRFETASFVGYLQVAGRLYYKAWNSA